MACKLIKIEIRNNLIYPVMFTIAVNILNIIRILLKEVIRVNLIIIYPLIMFISTVLFSLLLLYCQSRKKPSKKKPYLMKISLIKREKELNRVDSIYKIIILFILDAYFDFIGSLRRYYLRKQLEDDKNLSGLKDVDMRIRSREIFFSAILCFLTIKIKLYKHHIVALIIIFVFLIISFVLEIIEMIKVFYYSTSLVFKYLILQIILSICRVFSDVIEKYLLEFNYMEPYKILIFKNIIEVILGSFFLFDAQIHNEIDELKSLPKKFNKSYLSLILIIIYFIVAGFKNIYKIFTIKTYSPMVRTISDCFLDIFFYIWNSRDEIIKYQKITTECFLIDLFCKSLIFFFNLVYNEFLVLYCFGMEKNTHQEITKRAGSVGIIGNIEPIDISLGEIDNP